jgi:UDP-N-acetylmuramate--alanine ligase
MDFSKLQKVYMIGIKGVGMTMLAQFLASKGIKVSGSDIFEKFMTDQILKRNNIKVIEGFDRRNIPRDADAVIYSTAYSENTNEEVKEVTANGRVKALTFAQALSGVFNNFYGIAVCGSHGKTTTSAWLGYVMHRAGLEPNVMVGANVEQFQGSSLTGSSNYLVIEADEYQNKLENFNPKGVVLNNIEHDHHDFFKTEEDYISVFKEFIKKIPTKGFLVANYDDKTVTELSSMCRGKVISYGIDNQKADLVAYDIRQGERVVGGEEEKQFFKIKINIEEEGELGDFSIRLSGKHNIYNSLAVIAACLEQEMELSEIRTYLEEFTGTERRMQVLGEFNQALLIDDYAHHPTEVRTTLSGVRDRFPGKRIVTVFHPHTYSRTLALLEEFGQSFADSDEVVVLDIYGSAREKQGGVHSRDLVEEIKKNAKDGKPSKVSYIPTLKDCEKYLRSSVSEGDVILLMGAGDVFRIGEELIKNDK